jgi:phosphate transport system protein
MERHFDNSLLELKNEVLTMGGLVEKAIEHAIEGLHSRKPELLQEVLKIEDAINAAHIKVDETCLSLLATQSPLGRDLRLIVAIIKINVDLERMGDQAVNISLNAREYLQEPQLDHGNDLSEMASLVKVMVRESLDAFVKRDEELAKVVLERDDAVDAFKDKIFTTLLEQTGVEVQKFRQSLNLILIARNLERLGDHATNIAEDVIFVSSGKDIRHGNK